MPNILLDPSRWSDASPASPPAVWNGTVYDFTGDSGVGNQISAVANAGDTVSFTIDNLAASPVPTEPNGFQVLVNGSQVYAYDLRNVGTDTFTSDPLSDGDTLKIWANTQSVIAYTVDFTMTPTPSTIAAQDETIAVASNTVNNPVPSGVTVDGSPVAATLAIATQPSHGVAALQAGVMVYTPFTAYHGPDSYTYTGTFDGQTSAPATVTITVNTTQYNCECDDEDFPTKTLKQLRWMLMTRLGFAAMMVPPPGMVPLLDSFLIEAQELLYRRYKVFRCERWFTWSMTQGQRFYDYKQNDDAVIGLINAPTTVAVSTATSGGTLAAGAYGYVITATNADGETLPSKEVTQVTTGTTSENTVTWGAVAGATGYNIYGRTENTYTMLFMASVGSGTLTFVDNGSVTPSGNSLPEVNTTTSGCSKTIDPRSVTWVGISQNDNNWRPLVCGINPLRYTSIINSIPDSYEIRQCIEIWPAPPDSTWQLRIKGYFGLLPFDRDYDFTTVDYRAVFLLALGNAKMHYGQPDANNVLGQLTTFLGDLIAGTHNTRRYIPVDDMPLNAIRPRMVP